MQSSLLCTLNLKALNVKDIWVKANTSAHHTILSKLGVSRIIHPEEEMGARVAQALNYPMVNDYLSLGHGQYIVDINLPSSFSGRPIQTLLKGYVNTVSCLVLKRGQHIEQSPSLEFDLIAGDTVILCGPRESLIKIAPRLER